MFVFSSRRRHTRLQGDWSSDVCSSDLVLVLGLTMQLPTEDKYTYKKQYVETQIAILMGGRVAEELTQDDITTGAGNDIEREIGRASCRESARSRAARVKWQAAAAATAR